MRANQLAWSNSKPAFLLPEAESSHVKDLAVSRGNAPPIQRADVRCQISAGAFQRSLATSTMPSSTTYLAANLAWWEGIIVYVYIGQTVAHGFQG